MSGFIDETPDATDRERWLIGYAAWLQQQNEKLRERLRKKKAEQQEADQ